MSYEKLGSDQSQLAGLGGGVVSDQGSTLISGNTLGQTSQLFGPQALREIQAGIANGDFAVLPPDPTASISDTNPLPYWTWTPDANGYITLQSVENTAVASGNVLRVSIADLTPTSTTATLTRFVPVPGSGARSFAFALEATVANGSGTGTAARFKVGYQFYRADQTTTTGALLESTAVQFSSAIGTTLTLRAPNWGSSSTAFVSATVPADAAFVLVTLTPYTFGAVSGGVKTVDIQEVRLISGQANVLIPDEIAPATYGPAGIWQDSGTLKIQRDLGNATESVSIRMDAANITLYPASTGTVYLAGAGDISGALSVGGAIYPGGSSTRYWNISDSAVNTNGTLQARSGTAGSGPEIRSRGTTTYCGFYWDGAAFTITDPLKCFATVPTTSSAANARWDATTGGTLRYSTSSRRWKSDIEDVDAETLAAAKRLKPRHFRSQHQGEEGHRLLGMIAEEVDEAGLDCAVERDAEGQPLALDWNAITAALLARLEDAERRIAELEGRA